MATYKSLFDVSGTLGGYTLGRYRDKNTIRRKSNLTKERFMTDPAFEGSRKASIAFGQSARMARDLRHALDPYATLLGEGTQHHRLTKAIANCLHPRSTRTPGPGEPIPAPSKKRILPPADRRWVTEPVDPPQPPQDETQYLTPWGKMAAVLAGFRLNEDTPLRTYLSATPKFTVHADTLHLGIPTPNPNCAEFDKAGATHIQVAAVLAPLTPGAEAPEAYFSHLIPVDDVRTRYPKPDHWKFTHAFRIPTSAHPVAYVLAVGIQAVQVVDGTAYPLYTIRTMEVLHILESASTPNTAPPVPASPKANHQSPDLPVKSTVLPTLAGVQSVSPTSSARVPDLRPRDQDIQFRDWDPG